MSKDAEINPCCKKHAYTIFLLAKEVRKESVFAYHPTEYQYICDILNYCRAICAETPDTPIEQVKEPDAQT